MENLKMKIPRKMSLDDEDTVFLTPSKTQDLGNKNIFSLNIQIHHPSTEYSKL